MSFGIRDFGVILTILVLICFYVPFSSYYVWQLYAKTYRKLNATTFHSAVFLRQRYTSLSLIASIAYIVQFFDLSLWIFVYSDYYNKDELQSILISIASTIHLVTQFIITSSLTLRFWLINFNIKFSMMSENHEWKKIINSKYQEDEKKVNNIEFSMYNMMNNMQNTINSTQWILKHKSNFGNHRWCFKRALIVFIFLLSMIIFNEIVNHSDNNIIPKNMSWIPISFGLCIYGTFAGLWSVLLFLHCRAPRFSDNIFIKKELGYILQTMMFFLFIYIVFIIVFGLGISGSNVYQDHYFNEIIIIFHVIAFSNMLMLYVIVYYPLKKSKQFNRILDNEPSISRRELSVTATATSVHNGRSEIGYRERKHEEREERLRRIKIDDVLRNRYGYNAFIQHLSKEFSMENLLSMTEFLQFKLYNYRKYRHSVMNKELRRWFQMLPLDALPRSEIVYSGDPEYEEDMKNGGKRRKKITINLLKKQGSLSSVDSTKSASPAPDSPRSPQLTNYESPTRTISDNESGRSNGDPQIPEIVYSNSGKDDNLHDNQDMVFIKTVKQKARQLYIKYIKTSSEYEINISYELRLSYRNLLENENQWLENKEYNDMVKLRDMFDDCCVIMKRLITHSFTRFKQSKLFDKVKQELLGGKK